MHNMSSVAYCKNVDTGHFDSSLLRIIHSKNYGRMKHVLSAALTLLKPGDSVVDIDATVHNKSELPVGLWIQLLYPSCRVTLVIQDDDKRKDLENRIRVWKAEAEKVSNPVLSFSQKTGRNGFQERIPIRRSGVKAGMHALSHVRVVGSWTCQTGPRKLQPFELAVSSEVFISQECNLSLHAYEMERDNIIRHAFAHGASFSIKVHSSCSESFIERCQNLGYSLLRAENCDSIRFEEGGGASLLILATPLPRKQEDLQFLDLTEGCMKEKQTRIHNMFGAYLNESSGNKVLDFETIPAPTFACRLRCRFGLQRGGDGSLVYFVFDSGKTVKTIVNFPIACVPVQLTMSKLLQALKSLEDNAKNVEKDSTARDGCLFTCGVRAVHFRATMHGDMLITFIYDRPIENEIYWKESAAYIRHHLAIDCSIMARAKGQVVYLHSIGEIDISVKEALRLSDGRLLTYIQPEGSFSNPNGRINEQCLDWLCDTTTQIIASRHLDQSIGISSGKAGSDNMHCHKFNLLELYCGSGNHTVALAPFYDRIVAVELDTKLVDAAKRNAALNNTANIEFVHLHSHKFCGSLVRKREWRGANFDVVLVDPPRAGLDITTLACIQHYQHILYISCCPDSLDRDMKTLISTHRVQRFAIMDQFAGTVHLECGVHLKRR